MYIHMGRKQFEMDRRNAMNFEFETNVFFVADLNYIVVVVINKKLHSKGKCCFPVGKLTINL